MHVLHGEFVLDGDGAGALDEVLAVPDQEGVGGPDLSAVVLSAGAVGVQELHELFGVEEAGRLLAAEGIFYNIVVLVLAQPDPDGHGEAELLFLRGRGGDAAAGRLAEGGLGVGVADLLTQGQVPGRHVDAAVQEGDAALQAVGHAHLVGLEQDVALQPEVEVDVLHLLRVGEMADLFVEGRGQVFGIGPAGGVAEDPLPLVHGIDVGIADEALFDRPGPAHDKALALGVAGDPGDSCRGGPADAGGELLVFFQGEGLVVDDIAAEELIRSFPGQDDLHMLRGLAVDEVEGRGRGVRQGLVHIILDPGKFLPVFLRGDDLAVVLDPDFFGQGLGIGDLIVFFVIKANGKGLGSLEIGRDIGGVHAAGEEGGDLDVADHVVADGFLDRAVDIVDDPLVGDSLAGSQHGIEIAADPHFPVAADQIVAGGQAEDAAEKGLRQHGVLEGHVLLQGLEVDLPVIARVFKDALDLRSVDKAVPDLRVVEGLDPEHVTGGEELFFLRVPDDKGKHAAEPVQDPRAVLAVAVQQDLRVRIGPEGMALDPEHLPELAVVVDLPVEGDDQPAVLRLHGLIAALEIDDGQTAEAHGDLIVHIFSRAVGAAVDDPVHHIGKDPVAVLIVSCKSAYSAHR